MNVLGLPIDLPARAIGRALSDLGDLARVAREVPERLDDVQRRLDRALELAETIDRRMERALEIGERVDARAAAVLELGERIEERGTAMVELGEQLLEVGTLANERAVLMTDAAREVAIRGAEVAATLPTLERAVALAAPLEGTVERLGRIVDRLPGSRAGRPADEP